MSRLYEALRRAERERVAKSAKKSADPTASPKSGTERRRNQRASISLPILVYGRSGSGEPFHQETRTLQVGPSGCSFPLNLSVAPDQRLMIISQNKEGEQLARVVYVNAQKPQSTEVGVEFLEPRLQASDPDVDPV